MIIEIGNIIIDKISTLPFLDKYTGVVKPISFNDEKGAKKIFPVACNLTLEQCLNGKNHEDLCPDNSKKSVLYLEDKSMPFIKREGDLFFFQANYDLICWLNIPKLGLKQCSVSAKAFMSILNELPSTPFNSGVYQRIMINVLGQEPKSKNPFLKYTYDIETHQLLMYPYDYFIMPLQVAFAVNKRCINELILADPISCAN
jgi:hypothetical protein